MKIIHRIPNKPYFQYYVVCKTNRQAQKRLFEGFDALTRHSLNMTFAITRREPRLAYGMWLYHYIGSHEVLNYFDGRVVNKFELDFSVSELSLSGIQKIVKILKQSFDIDERSRMDYWDKKVWGEENKC